MGLTALNRIGNSVGLTIDPDPRPDGLIELTFEEFEQAVTMLQTIGLATERDAEQAWEDFRGWRVHYEGVAYRLADRFTAPPSPWSGCRRNLPRRSAEPGRASGLHFCSYELSEQRPVVVNSTQHFLDQVVEVGDYEPPGYA